LLSPQGKRLGEPIPLLEAFRDSSYAPTLAASLNQVDEVATQQPPASISAREQRHGDPMHTNSVQVLTPELAPRFPQFKAGQVLISVRNMNTIAVVDPTAGTVVWAAQGPWKAQHDAQFLSNGRLLIFDNLGSPQTSRCLEYDPKTSTVCWQCPGESEGQFRSKTRGMSQRLPNGNTLLVDSAGGTMYEMTAGRERVWSCSVPGFLHSARRYSAEQLPFLKGGVRARP
jgi:hypothetical protein